MKLNATVCFILVVVSALPSAAYSGKMEHNSFLNEPASSVSTLVSQFESDRTVQKRFIKHFKTNVNSLKQYLSGLRLKPLTATKRYVVYNIDKRFKVNKRMILLSKGTLVFADKAGKPILKMSCGNPMVSFIPLAGQTSIRFLVPKMPVLPAKPMEEAFLVETEYVPEPIDSSLSEEPIIETATSIPAVTPPTPVAQTFPQPPMETGPGLGFLPLIGIIPIIDWIGSEDVPIEPVPEPMSLAVLAIGAGSLLLRRRRR